MSTPKLNKELQTAFLNFLELVPPQRLGRNLRNMLLLFLIYEKEGVIYEKEGVAPDMEDMLIDIYYLFDLLDTATKVWDSEP